MIFADKLVQLRKKSGWSQEELAAQMGVSRQSVSKWESAQSIPDLERIVRLSKLFGVSVDFLIKDELEPEDEASPRSVGTLEIGETSDTPARVVSLEEANEFLEMRAKSAAPIALGVLLCVLSSAPLVVLASWSEASNAPLSEDAASGLGVSVILLAVAVAVAIFLYNGIKLKHFEYLKTERIETAYGITGMVNERKARFRDTYTKSVIVAVVLFILSAVPLLMVSLFVPESNSLAQGLTIAVLLVLVGIGAYLLVRVGIIWGSYNLLLQEDDYTPENKRRQPIVDAMVLSYWMVCLAIYLGYSLISGNWEQSWIVFAVAGVLFPVVKVITKAIADKRIR